MMTSRSTGFDLLKLIVVVGLVVICSPPLMTQELPASWTFLVYLDGDNDLEEYAILNLNQMEQVGSSADVNIVVQFDRIPGYDSSNGDWTGCRRYYVTQDADPVTINSTLVQDLGEVNMGDGTTLQDFIEWGVANYPADKYALVFWNHGGGWRTADLKNKRRGPDKPLMPRAVCWDDTSGGDPLYTKEWASALASAGAPLELAGFDVCLAGMIEPAYELVQTGLVSAMVASPPVEPAPGWPYDAILADLVGNPAMSGLGLASTVVTRYSQSQPEFAMSAYDLSYVGAAAAAVSNLAATIVVEDTEWATIATAREAAQTYAFLWFYVEYQDIRGFAENVRDNVSNPAIQSAASAAATALGNLIYSFHAGEFYPDGRGISVSFPDNGPESEYNASTLDWAGDTQWDEFLAAFASADIAAPPAPNLLPIANPDEDGDYLIDWDPVTDASGIAGYRVQEWEGDIGLDDDAESGTSLWTLGGFALSASRSHGGTYSFYSGAADYLSNTMTLAAPISLPASGTSTLSYWAWYDIELGWDNAYVAISADGGTTWDILAAYTGSAGWNRYTHDISVYNGQTVLVTFAYVTDFMIYEEGIYFDDIAVATLDETAQWSVGAGQTDLALTGRPMGTWLYTVRAQDGGGNWSALSNIRSATVACGIAGTITKSGGGPLAGVEVTADGHSASTAGDGRYTIPGLTLGTYTVTPTLAGYIFVPHNAGVTLTEGAPQAADVDFVGTTCTVSGTVTDSDTNPLEGVTITVDGHSTTTLADGSYTVTEIAPGTYTVTPTLSEYEFAPPDQPVTVSVAAPDAIGMDFVGTQKTYSISGTIVDEEDAAMEGVTVTINGQSTTTLSDGTYTISGFVAGTYTVTPSLTEHRFTPSSSSATVNESVGNAVGVDFVGTNKIHSISGRITDDESHNLEGATVTADGHSTTTAANGTYTIDRLVAGTYTVTPSMPEYDFAPLSTEVSVSDVLGEATNVDFVGTEKTYTISGTITNEQDEPMEGVELSASGKSTTTGPDGTYMLEELVAGTHSVKPSFSEYNFTPSRTSATVNENDGPATDVDFVGSPKQYTMSGTILDWEGNAMSGVEVSANGHSATTDDTGEYSIAGPVAGTYTVIPEQAGRGFVPGSQEVTVNENVGDASDIDFTGYPAYTTQLLAGLSLVGVPCQPVTDDLSEVFATDEVFRWGPDGEPPGYLGVGDSGAGPLLALAAGKAYFVRHTTPQEISVLGLLVPTDTTFQLPLGTNSGWNLVANPFPQALLFSSIMIEASHILPYGFVYDTATGSYQVVTDKVGANITRNSLEPWEGMWVRALQSPATLFIQPPGPAAAEAESAVRAADLGPRGWAIPVTARVGDRADLSSVCGVSDNQAAYQIDNPPAVSGAVDLYFVTDQGRHLAHDVRPASVGQTTWDFVVCTDIPDSEVQVRLSDLSAVPHDLTVLLTDLDAQRTVYARTVPLYTFHSSAEGVTVRHFRLQVQPKSDAGLVISSAAVHPAPAGLTIAYTVSQPCAVTIEITNISGRLINRVCSAQPVAAGVNTTTWSLRSQEGTQVPSGRYLICLQAVAANGQSVTRIVSTQIVR